MTEEEMDSLLEIADCGGVIIGDECTVLHGPPHAGVWVSGPHGAGMAMIRLTPPGMAMAKAESWRRDYVRLQG